MVEPTVASIMAALLSRFSFKTDINYEKKKYEFVYKWETDSFKVCNPLRERVWKYGIIPKRRYIHRTDDDRWDWIDIWVILQLVKTLNLTL